MREGGNWTCWFGLRSFGLVWGSSLWLPWTKQGFLGSGRLLIPKFSTEFPHAGSNRKVPTFTLATILEAMNWWRSNCNSLCCCYQGTEELYRMLRKCSHTREGKGKCFPHPQLVYGCTNWVTQLMQRAEGEAEILIFKLALNREHCQCQGVFHSPNQEWTRRMELPSCG